MNKKSTLKNLSVVETSRNKLQLKTLKYFRTITLIIHVLIHPRRTFNSCLSPLSGHWLLLSHVTDCDPLLGRPDIWIYNSEVYLPLKLSMSSARCFSLSPASQKFPKSSFWVCFQIHLFMKLRAYKMDPVFVPRWQFQAWGTGLVPQRQFKACTFQV